MADRLKSCPFCGGEAEIVAIPSGKNRYSYSPRCKDRSCCGRNKKQWVDLETAVYAWNKRARVITGFESEDYDKRETYSDCTVQILTNTETKNTGMVWWRNDGN